MLVIWVSFIFIRSLIKDCMLYLPISRYIFCRVLFRCISASFARHCRTGPATSHGWFSSSCLRAQLNAIRPRWCPFSAAPSSSWQFSNTECLSVALCRTSWAPAEWWCRSRWCRKAQISTETGGPRPSQRTSSPPPPATTPATEWDQLKLRAAKLARKNYSTAIKLISMACIRIGKRRRTRGAFLAGM